MNQELLSIENQFEDLRSEYPGLSLADVSPQIFLVQGMLDFKATYNEITIEDVFDIAISIPKDFPQRIPKVWETGGRIPRNHHTYDYGGLCLGASLAIRMMIVQDPSLKSYVKNQVIPYLYSFLYKEFFKEMPYGELSHGGEGIIEYYCDLFNTDSSLVVIGLLEVLAGSYRGHHPCPCGSGRKLRDCHGALIREISSYQGKEWFEYDVTQCKIYLSSKGKNARSKTIPK